MTRHFGLPPSPPTWLIGAAAVVTMAATIALAVYLAMKGHGHA